MNRRATVVVAALACAGVATSPSLAAPKKKPPITGTYKLQLPPDPTANVLSTAGQGGQCGLNTRAQDKHPFTVPAAGTLKLVIDSQDPKPGTPYVFDWDVFLNDAQGELGAGNTGEAHDEIVMKFKKKSDVTFLACNLNGLPDATVTYSFTYA